GTTRGKGISRRPTEKHFAAQIGSAGRIRHLAHGRAGGLSLRTDDYFFHGLIRVIVFDADGEGVLAGRQGERQVVIQFGSVAEPGDGRGDLPLASVHRVLALDDVVQGVGGVPFGGGSRGGEAGDPGRRVID